MIGTKIGNYCVVEQIGEGGMGVVYSAKHTLLDKTVAVKVLLPKYSDNEEVVSRFFNEAKATTMIDHPGIVELYDFGHLDDGSAYIVMEYLAGESLDDRIQTRGPMPYPEAAKLIARIAGIMTAAHAHGIVHRDLKPENIFLVPDPGVDEGERPKVLDFGIAKLNDDGGLDGDSKVKTRTGSIIGSPLYMSPEQCRGSGTVDYHSDIYSLGCILYELLVGAPPFDEEGVGEIIGAHLHLKPDDPYALVNDLPAALGIATLKALAKKPEDRHDSMEAFARALRRSVGATTEEFSNPFDASAKDEESGPTAAAGKTAGGRRRKVGSGQADVSPFARTRAPEPTTLGLSTDSGSVPAVPENRRSSALFGIVLVGAIAAGGFAYWNSTSDSETRSAPAAGAAGQATPQTEATPIPTEVLRSDTIAIESDDAPKEPAPLTEPATISEATPKVAPPPPASLGKAELKAKARADKRTKKKEKAEAKAKEKAEAMAKKKTEAKLKADAKAEKRAKKKAKTDAKKANALTQPKPKTKRAGDGALDPFNQ